MTFLPHPERRPAVVTGASTVDQALPVAMVGLGVGSVPLYVALARGGEIPRWLGAFGALGYGALVVGEILQLSGVPVGLALSAPGGLFEVIFGGWLLAGQIGDGGGAR